MKVFTWRQRIFVIGITVAIVGIFLFIGYLIGKRLNNLPLAIILAVLISYPITQFTLFRSIKRIYTKKEN